MKKKIFYAVIMAAITTASVTTLGYAKGYNKDFSILTIANIEALTNDETDIKCDAGGKGATSCTIAQSYPGGIGTEKSVSCGEGYYACCKKSSWGDLSAECIKN